MLSRALLCVAAALGACLWLTPPVSPTPGGVSTPATLRLSPSAPVESAARPVGAFVGGATSPDGETIQVDLPGPLHRRNTASRGLGNCVFTSIHHAALWQNVPALQEFPKWLIDKGIPGGGYPAKVDKLIPEMCRDRGVPVPEYLQIEGQDLEMLRLALRTGRMPGVTYAYSATGRYRGRIAHMVNLVHASDRYWVVLDNNFPGPDKYEWLTREEFLRAYTGGGAGWSVILLSPPPPPPPRN